MTRVLLAPENPAGVASTLRDALRGRGHAADLVVLREHPFGYPHDRLAATYAARLREAAAAPARYDVLHFHFGTTLAEFAEAAAARAAGRVALMHYWGSDARTTAIAERLGSPRAATPRDDRTVLRRLRMAGRVCHAALVSDLELAAYVRPFFERVYLVATPLAGIEGAAPQPATASDPPVVLHAPSQAATKGTAEILPVLERLEAEGVLRARMVSGVPHAEVLAAIAAADVVVDQLDSETPGVFALEAMAAGRPVLVQFRRDRLAPFARVAPLVPITAQTLEGELRRLCGDAEIRRAAGDASALYVADVHAAPRVAAALEHVYAHARSGPPGLHQATPAGVVTT